MYGFVGGSTCLVGCRITKPSNHAAIAHLLTIHSNGFKAGVLLLEAPDFNGLAPLA